jgi:beta-xylosidase
LGSRARRAALLVLCVGAVVVACQPVKKAAPPPPPPPPPTPTVPTPAVPTPAVSNPDYPDFPDPFALEDGGTGYLAASTNSDLIRMPTVASDDLATWDETDELLQGPKPTWVKDNSAGFWWAPAVWKQSESSYFLYYTARHIDGRQCIGGAAAITPEGPYVVGDFETTPVVCQATTGSIDPSVFVAANGEAWLLWKSDGNCCGLQSYIWAQPLDEFGRRKPGTAVVKLIGVTQVWEFGTGPHNTTVEGPSVVASGGSYYLFYSASDWKSSKYATGYAKCSALADGACTKPQNGPILASGTNGRGPGGGEVFADHANGLWLAYHAWNPNKPIGYPSGDRRFHISRLSFVAGIPRFGNAP